MKQYDNLKNLLKGAKSTSGADLYAHLQETFKKLILHFPDQGLDKIEEVSYLLKHQMPNGLKMEDFLKFEEIHNYQNVSQNLQAYIEKIQGAPKKVREFMFNTQIIEASNRRRRRRGRRG